MFKYLVCLMHSRKYERLFYRYLLIIHALIFKANSLTVADHSLVHPMHTNINLPCVLFLVFKYVCNILECFKSANKIKFIRKLKQLEFQFRETTDSHMLNWRSELFFQLFLKSSPTNQEPPHGYYKVSLFVKITMKMTHCCHSYSIPRLFSNEKRPQIM